MVSKFSISLTLLLYTLKIPFEKYGETEFRTSPDKIQLYSEDMKYTEGNVIVGRLSDTMPIWSLYPGCYFLCLRNRFPDAAEKNLHKENVIIFRTNCSVESIYNKIVNICIRLQQWNTDMLIEVMSNHGIQSLIDLSEDIIGNHIDVLDATFKLLAYTKNILIDDTVTEYLIKHGYHHPKTIQRFKELRRIEEFERNDNIIFTTDHEMCRYETVKRVFHVNGRVQLYVVMHCNRKRMEPGIVELFQHMLIYIKQYVDRIMLNPSDSEVSRDFIIELLEHKVKTKDEAIDRAAYISIPFQKKYCLFQIVFRDQFNISLESVVKELTAQLPFAYVLPFNRHIVILKYLEDNQSYSSLKNQILFYCGRCLADTPCIIGASNIFDNLWQITGAMEQAGYAAEYGTHVEKSVKEKVKIPMYDFEQCFLTLILAKSINQSPGVFDNSFTMCSIERIAEYDKKHGTAMLLTLEIWLDNGKKATDVCQFLHMHRNTVLYHIERIEKLLNVSLHDEEVCMKLKLGILMRKSNMQELVTK